MSNDLAIYASFSLVCLSIPLLKDKLRKLDPFNVPSSKMLIFWNSLAFFWSGEVVEAGQVVTWKAILLMF